MAVNTKVVKRRIKSIGNTKKITKAMELVAAAKMRKAVKAALSTRAYATLAREMLKRLSQMKNLNSLPLMQIRPVKKVLLVVMTSNRGLCGGLNTNVFKKVLEQVRTPVEHAVFEAVTVGKTGDKMMRKLGIKIIASFTNLSDTPRLMEAAPIAQIVNEEFVKKNYDRVMVIYTDFVSTISQRPAIKQLLPVSPFELERMLHEAGKNSPAGKTEPGADIQPIDFIFEPNPLEILKFMLPRLMETQVFQALLESSASEQSARMMAMRNASDAASDMIDDLTFALNQARQAGITREIAEIAGGAAALE